jgi:DNA processing protein
LSAGTNALLRLGATPVTCAADVLEAIGVAAPELSPPEVEGVPEVVLAALADGAATADQLSRVTGLPPSEVAAALVSLELDGLVSSDDAVYRATTIAR